MNDPINPAHYAGTACAQIGERLTANSYQVLKYNWRLGKKDEPVIEVRKSLRYLDREILLAGEGFEPQVVLPEDEFFDDLLRGVDNNVHCIAWMLIWWNRYGDKEQLVHLREAIVSIERSLVDEVIQPSLNLEQPS